ncbi:hypothetical protein BKA62DRAFT_380705 [Auriculariales sp. MPI-PUGE-AT-0066]|nr:hypothetical protein BKA62DRAFT_380705 [Auriculariales sp. MPI-PUGE-AT-0066]
MDSTLSTTVLAADILAATMKPIPVVGNGLGHAIEAFGKLLQAIEKAKHNKQDLQDFGRFVTNELAKIKTAVDDAPENCRADLDARFSGVTTLLSEAKIEAEALASQNFLKRVAVSQKAKDKLTELKDRFKEEVLSFLMMASTRLEQNQLREQAEQELERKRQDGEREKQDREREEQRLAREKQDREREEQRLAREKQDREHEQQERERERQRREREQALLESKLTPVAAGTALGKDAPSGCMPDTRVELLKDITTWANDGTAACVLWLTGLAGTGKSTVSRSAADRLAKEGKVVISFFISRHGNQRGSLQNIIHTLAFELARAHEKARIAILKVFEDHPKLCDLNLDEQVNHLLLEPLKAISAAHTGVTTVLILDALDECDNAAALVGDGCLAKLIPALGDQASLGNVKLFLTSRPLTTIGTALRPFLNRLGREVRLHEIPTTDDIRTYLDRSLSELCHSHNMPTDWFSASDLDSLVHRAGSLFIYAATVIRHIKEDVYAPHERLAEVLSIATTSGEVGSPYEEVDRLYLEVLSLSVGPRQPKSLPDRVRQIIAVVVLAREPMSTRMISNLLSIDHGTVQRIVSGLGAVWVTPASESDPIVLYHKSFPDFILDASRCTDPRFLVNCSTGHERLTTGCLHVLNTLLVRDICKIPFPAGQNLPRRDSIKDIDTRLARHVSAPLRYSTVHLLHHLAQISVADISAALVGNLRVFCQDKLMFWLELTCLMGPTTLSDLIIQLTGFPAEILSMVFFCVNLGKRLSTLKTRFELLMPRFTTRYSPSCRKMRCDAHTLTSKVSSGLCIQMIGTILRAVH